jgi:hypothetical protein
MKLIMEGWKTFLKEGKSISPLYTNLEFLDLLSQIDNLDEASWKKRLAGLGLAGALGVGGGAGISTAIPGQDSATSAPSSQDFGGLTSMPTFGKSDKAADTMPLDMEWGRSPTRGEYVWVSPEQFAGMEDTYILPLSSMAISDYRALMSEPNWSIENLHKLLYGDSGQWSYSKSSHNTFDSHPESGLQMLPPDWSIVFDVYKDKIETATDHIQQQIKNSNDGGDSIAKSLGHEGVEGLRAELEELNHSIQY